MEISVELTLMPLQADYEPPIQEFIKALRASEFTVLENPLSTQVYGDFNKVMPFLTEALKTSFDHLDGVIANMKIVKSDRSDYVPNF
ncbi:hypothetical protein FNB79_05675 [Formosa sediminum]|uniref:Thiamine-binding protein domain-containing protein n=1 Tax=Formosa sediminum TaxID=2594004 RepID=A0A516GPN1_9FLAO|nr:thiamine-binding protein [Formosa sediminum]QDO93487.1 hypothetical protein FNB79_05675 [Formosa sediminum]